MSAPVAAIDLGTNSTRLLVVAADGTDLVRRATVTRLGAGVGTSRTLRPDAIARTVAELAEHRRLLDAHGVEQVRIVATSAARDADNRDELFAAVSATLGRPVDLVTGAAEGRLAFAGALSGLAPVDGATLVIDIGGGSTEFVLGGGGLEVSAVSVDMGSVRLTEAELHSDPPRPEELTNALGVVSDHLDDVFRDLPGVEDVQRVVGVAGTITTIAAIELGGYDRDAVHGFQLTRDAAEDVFRTLATERLADRVHNPGLDPARADVIVGGCCVLVGIMRRLHLGSILVSETDLLDGIAADLRTALP